MRLKTHSRLSDFYKTNQSIKTDKGELLFRIDSPGSVPQDPESTRSEPEIPPSSNLPILILPIR